MLNVFVLNNRRLNQLQVDSIDDLKNSEPIWIDLVSPTETESEWIKTLYQLPMPTAVLASFRVGTLITHSWLPRTMSKL